MTVNIDVTNKRIAVLETPVPISGTVTATTGGLTDTQLRAAAVPVKGVDLSTASAISGQITVTTPGTAVQGPTVALTNGCIIKGHKANTGLMYIYHATGDGRAGYEVSPDQQVPVQVANMNQLWIDASVGGEKVSWIKL